MKAKINGMRVIEEGNECRAVAYLHASVYAFMMLIASPLFYYQKGINVMVWLRSPITGEVLPSGGFWHAVSVGGHRKRGIEVN